MDTSTELMLYIRHANASELQSLARYIKISLKGEDILESVLEKIYLTNPHYFSSARLVRLGLCYREAILYSDKIRAKYENQRRKL